MSNISLSISLDETKQTLAVRTMGIWRVKIIVCKVVSSVQKEFVAESIVLWRLNMDFAIFFNVILSDLSKLSLGFKT